MLSAPRAFSHNPKVILTTRITGTLHRYRFLTTGHLYLQDAGNPFTVALAKPVSEDVRFSWWLVN
jgi:hypothetical protein